MMGWVTGRRKLLALGAVVLLAGCKVIPDSGQPGTTPRPDQGPTDALPDDEGRHRIALLVPTTGTNAAVGEAIANATTMALLDTNASSLRITTYDTATGAESAAARAMQDGNKLVLGPLLGSDVAGVISQARRQDVPMITYSNDVSVAQRDVFVMGHIPDQSIARTVAYAANQGHRRFAALIPNGEYGDRVIAAFRAAVGDSGGGVVALQRYDRGNTSIVSAAQRLAATGPFDAVLIAEGARLSQMAAAEIRKTNKDAQILGTELWSGESGIARNAALRGALFSSVSDARFGRFVESYRSRFGNQPHRIATLGYDSVLLTLRIARDLRPGRDFPVSQVTDPGGFVGIDGPFRFRRNGVGERAMEVRQVGNGTVAVVDPAPTQFD
jgi:ABC-type branched-subunit amino acid transport system substrate-binding protein